MAYWRAFYHGVWTTKHRQPLITSAYERDLYAVMIEQCQKNGFLLHAINGMPDHVHVVASMPPSVPFSVFVKKLKGTSGWYANKVMDEHFTWQRGYGMFTISERLVDRAIDYVVRQKEHHASNTTIARLEYVTREDDGPAPRRPDPGRLQPTS